MPRKGSRPFRVTITRYVDQHGKRCKSTTPGAIRHVEKSESWYAKIKGETVPLNTTDEATAWNRLNQLLRRQVEQDLGIRDQYTDAAARDFTSHVEEWLAVVAAGGATSKQVGTLRSNVLRLKRLASWQRITDISADTVLLALARLQSEQDDRGKTLSAQTRNHSLKHIKQFVKWLVDGGRLRSDPLRLCRPVSVEDDRRHMRRVPTDDEVSMLFSHLMSEQARVRKGMTGRQRALGYKVSMATGFRANELRDLDRACFDLDRATVTLRARADKTRKPVTQPIPQWLVDELRAWFASGGGCWEGFPEVHPGRLLKADLAAAGVEYVIQGPHGPLYFDFHSLRYYFISALAAQEGISIKTLMELSRHSTPMLTLAVYAQARGEDLRKAAERLPEVGRPKK